MKSVLKKSSFTLPAEELSLVYKLKKQLRLKSNTGVIRRALQELEKNVDRQSLREQFTAASRLVCAGNSQEMATLDQLSDENL